MPYAVKFYAYIFVANVLAFVIVARWLHPFGFVASLAFGLVFAYLTIVTGRRVWGEKISEHLGGFVRLVSVFWAFFVVSQFDGSFFSKVSNIGQTSFACH